MKWPNHFNHVLIYYVSIEKLLVFTQTISIFECLIFVYPLARTRNKWGIETKATLVIIKSMGDCCCDVSKAYVGLLFLTKSMSQAQLAIRRGANSPLSHFDQDTARAHLRRSVKIFLHARHQPICARESWKQLASSARTRFPTLCVCGCVCNPKKSFFPTRKNGVRFTSLRLRAYTGRPDPCGGSVASTPNFFDQF